MKQIERNKQVKVSFFIATLLVLMTLLTLNTTPHTESYWDKHGIVLLFFLALTPRLALFFSSIPFGGLLWWVGFFFCPRYLIAALATVNYWHSNPFLVAFSWLMALGGETSEKYYIQKRFTTHRSSPERTYQRPSQDGQVIDIEPIG